MPVLLLITGCANRIPFTQSLRTRYNLADSELRGLQYYVSDTIVLHREVTSGLRKVSEGKLVTRSGRNIDEVIVSHSTPGVAEEVGESWLAISFEEGTRIYFGLKESRGTGLQSKYWLKYSFQVPNRRMVSFDGIVYEAIGYSYLSHLLIDKESLAEIERRRRKLPGRRLPEMGEIPVPSEPDPPPNQDPLPDQPSAPPR